MAAPKLDFSALDAAEFQRLINELVRFEYSGTSSTVIGGDPDAGADRGLDCVVIGKHRIAIAATIQKTGLATKFEADAEKARKWGAQEFIFATPLPVSKGKQREAIEHAIESWSSRFAHTPKLWHREELTARVKDLPWVLQRYFRIPARPSLVPGDSDDVKAIDRMWTILDGIHPTLQGREDVFHQFAGWLASQRPVLAIVGPRG